MVAAGTIKDLYVGIAKLCGINSERPEKLLLLVETYDGRVKQKFVDLSEALADAIRGTMTLLAYKYSKPEEGPSSNGKEIHIFQRYAHLFPSRLQPKVNSPSS